MNNDPELYDEKLDREIEQCNNRSQLRELLHREGCDINKSLGELLFDSVREQNKRKGVAIILVHNRLSCLLGDCAPLSEKL